MIISEKLTGYTFGNTLRSEKIFELSDQSPIRESIVRNSVVRAILENGLFRPLDPVEIADREQVTLRIARPERVRASSGILAITDFELIRDVAESEEYSILA